MQTMESHPVFTLAIENTDYNRTQYHEFLISQHLIGPDPRRKVIHYLI